MANFESSLACIEYWPTNPYHPIIRPIIESIGEINEFNHITGIWACSDDFKKANICLLQFENFLSLKLGKKFIKKNHKYVKRFINSRSWKSLPFEVNSKESICFHHSIPLRIPSKWNIFQFEDLLSLYMPFFHAGITKTELEKRENEFKIISQILKVYFEHPSIILIATHYEKAKEDFINFIGGDGVKKIKVIPPFVNKNNSISNTSYLNKQNTDKIIKIIFTGSHHGNPDNLLARGIQYTFKFALEISKILEDQNLDSKVELNVIAPSSTRIKDYVGLDGLSDFKKEIKRVSNINYGDRNPSPKLQINYLVNRVTDQEMSFLKNSSDLYPDFAETVHTSSIFEAFCSNTLYLGLRKELTSEFTDSLKSNNEGLFINKIVDENSSTISPSSITRGSGEENKIYGSNFEQLTILAQKVLKVINNQSLIRDILIEQSNLFQQTSNKASSIWFGQLEEISSNITYQKLFKSYNKKMLLKDLFGYERVAKLQTLFYRNMYLETRKNFYKRDVQLLEKFKNTTNTIIKSSSYPHSIFSDTTYKVSKFDLILKANVKTNIKESNAQIRDIFYILIDIFSKTKSIIIENSNHIESLSLNDIKVTNITINFLGNKKIKFTGINGLKLKFKKFLLSIKKLMKNLLQRIFIIYRNSLMKLKFITISLFSNIFRL